MSLVLAMTGALALLLLFEGATGRVALASGRLKASLERLVQESGMTPVSAERLVAISGAAGAGAFVVAAGVTSTLIVAAFLAAAAAWSPFSIARSRRKKRRRRFREAWPDALATLVAGVRSGVSLPESCAALAVRGPADLQPGWGAFAATYRATGSFRAGLERLAAELADPIADRVVAALALAHEVGGTDLVRVLRTLGDFVREDLKVRKEIEARWSWTVTAARVAAAAPWIVLVLMSTQPETAAAYNSPGGATVVIGGAFATAAGYGLMLRVARLPEDRRLIQ